MKRNVIIILIGFGIGFICSSIVTLLYVIVGVIKLLKKS